jgi:hypothetical protein
MLVADQGPAVCMFLPVRSGLVLCQRRRGSRTCAPRLNFTTRLMCRSLREAGVSSGDGHPHRLLKPTSGAKGPGRGRPQNRAFVLKRRAQLPRLALGAQPSGYNPTSK